MNRVDCVVCATIARIDRHRKRHRCRQSRTTHASEAELAVSVRAALTVEVGERLETASVPVGAVRVRPCWPQPPPHPLPSLASPPLPAPRGGAPLQPAQSYFEAARPRQGAPETPRSPRGLPRDDVGCLHGRWHRRLRRRSQGHFALLCRRSLGGPRSCAANAWAACDGSAVRTRVTSTVCH